MINLTQNIFNSKIWHFIGDFYKNNFKFAALPLTCNVRQLYLGTFRHIGQTKKDTVIFSACLPKLYSTFKVLRKKKITFRAFDFGVK